MPYEINTSGHDIFNEPVLLTENKLREIEKLLETVDPQLILDPTKLELPEWREPEIEAGVAVINLKGALTTKPSFYSWLFGGNTYEGILRQMTFLASRDDVKTILLDVDGPGGQAYRMMETGRKMREIADRSGKKLIAYVDGTSASATAGLTVAAHEVVINPEAEFGSIGVVVRLSSDAEAMKKYGYKEIYITAGKSKVPFDNEGEYKTEYLQEIQTKIDKLYDNFTSYVAANRNISQEVVKNTEAKMLSAEEAQSLGFVDKIMEVEDFYTYLADITEASTPIVTSSITSVIDTKITTQAAALADEQNLKLDNGEPMPNETLQAAAAVDQTELLAQVASMQAQMDASASLIASYQAKEDAQKRTELTAQFSAPFLSDSKESLVNFCMSADVSEDHKALLTAVITSASKELSSLVEACDAKVLEAEAKATEAEAAKEDIKEEFSTTQTSIEGESKDQLSAQAKIDARAAELKASQNK